MLSQNNPQSPLSLFESSPSAEVEQAFVRFIAQFGRTYASKDEIDQRFKNFQRTYNMVKEHNARPDASFQMAINQFADLSEEDT